MTSDPRMHVMHIITGLGDGGAEAVLFRLVTSDNVFRHSVVSLSGFGRYGNMLCDQGISVYELGMCRSWPSVTCFHRLIKLITASKPDVVQTWMYHADLCGGLAALLAGIRAIVWGLHNTSLDSEGSSARTRAIARLNAILSKAVPCSIVSCSEKGVHYHRRLGYASKKLVTIPNGYDLGVFKPDACGGRLVRAEFGVAEDVPLFGCVARCDPQKDHQNLFAAFAIVKRTVPRARLLLVGRGVTRGSRDLVTRLERLNIGSDVILAGQRTDIPNVMNAIDVHVLSSAFGEAFPNVICEAMACGTPCVATDVGDCRAIVGDTGAVCCPRDPVALAEAMVRILEAKTKKGGSEECRSRVAANFGIMGMVARYHEVWRSAVGKARIDE